MKDIKIYCTYHDDQLILKYNLKETDQFKLFNVNKNIQLDNINYLNKYFGELVTYYYIWKNQIKSDLVGFCHYRRHFHYIYEDYIDDQHVQSYSYYGEEYFKNNYMFLEYVKNKYNLTSEKFYSSDKLSYIFTWNIFNKVCECIFGYMDYLGKKINKNWKDENNITYFRDLLDEKKIINIHDNRFIGITFEYNISYFISNICEINSFEDKLNNLIIYNNETNKDLLLKIMHKNLKTGCRYILNISNLNFSEEEIGYYHISIINDYLNCSFLFKEIQYDSFLINININNSYDIINIINILKRKYNIILLKNNEYIECNMFNNLKEYKICKL